jgi:hypothetical protein
MMRAMNDKRFAMITAIVLVAMAAASRAVPHPWNFTPMIAVALFGGARLERAWVAVAAVVACLVAGDVAVGAFPYDGMAWVYGAMIAIVLGGTVLRTRGVPAALVGALAAGLLFFVVTNLGVWIAGGLYPRTAGGLADCFTAAVPFYRNQVVGDLLFTGALFGLHAIATGAYARRAIAAA